jgi:hypothetical protein
MNSPLVNIDVSLCDARVVNAAWDATIYRHYKWPIYHFCPPGEADAQLAERLGVDHCSSAEGLKIIHRPYLTECE